MKQPALVWFKNDLRLHDNEMLCEAVASGRELICVYCIDPRHFKILELGFEKTGENRFLFLKECLDTLTANLKSIGGDLLVLSGKPEEILPRLVKHHEISTIYTHEDYAIEELKVFNNLKNALPSSCTIQTYWGFTLYHKLDIPYAIEDIPMTSKTYRMNVTKNTHIRQSFLKPNKINLLKYGEQSEFPELSELFPNTQIASSSQLMVKGGEDAALERLAFYSFGSELLTSYRWTRNRSLGLDYSSKFSPYLALGCISPRIIYETVKDYELKIKKNASTWWLIFEMVWRDFFTFKGMKMGASIYQTEGYSKKTLQWDNNRENFKKWCEGSTGIPFVDAHMRQLNQTGFMSNRGRVNCSSYMIHDLKIDWTWGAAYFENKLLDYDPHVNWMNWHYQAYEIWYTNPVHQSLKYKAHEFIQKWIPELQGLEDYEILVPWLVESKSHTYQKPIEIYSKWTRAINKILKTKAPV